MASTLPLHKLPEKPWLDQSGFSWLITWIPLWLRLVATHTRSWCPLIILHLDGFDESELPKDIRAGNPALSFPCIIISSALCCYNAELLSFLIIVFFLQMWQEWNWSPCVVSGKEKVAITIRHSRPTRRYATKILGSIIWSNFSEYIHTVKARWGSTNREIILLCNINEFYLALVTWRNYHHDLAVALKIVGTNSLFTCVIKLCSYMLHLSMC